MARSPAWSGVLCLLAPLWATGASAQAPDQPWWQRGTQSPATQATPIDGPTWRWQQILASPRVGGRLTAVTVDPDRPNRIFVGTEEGTILRSLDGGVTWREFDVRPFVLQARTIRPRTPGLPSLGEQTRLGVSIIVDPPFRRTPADRLSLNLSTLWFSLRPEFIWVGFLPIVTPPPDALLFDAVRTQHTEPVYRVAVCPGSEYELLVELSRDVFGSKDGGLTYVRLLRVPGFVTMRHLVCSRSRPNEVLVSSGYGLFRSHDGGNTFDQELGGWPGQPSNASAFSAQRRGRVFVSASHVLFAGDPDSDEGLVMVYPDFDNSSTAPWMDINWIEATSDRIWLATDDGLRLSRDEGRTWEAVAPLLLSRQVIHQVREGPNEAGGRRVAVIVRDCPRTGRYPRCRNSMAYASDDGGRTWHPFFVGATRRTLLQMAVAPSVRGVPPRWWIVTGGELWATVPPRVRDDSGIEAASAAWASTKLRSTPPLQVVLDDALDNLHLSNRRIREVALLQRSRNWAPILHFGIELRFDNDLGSEQRRSILGAPIVRDYSRPSQRVEALGFLVATWTLDETVLVRDRIARSQREIETMPVRGALYQLQRQVIFVMEDAWHERVLQLRRIAGGMSDPLQVEIIKARIEVLEAILELWLGRPLDSNPVGGG